MVAHTGCDGSVLFSPLLERINQPLKPIHLLFIVRFYSLDSAFFCTRCYIVATEAKVREAAQEAQSSLLKQGTLFHQWLSID